MSAGQPSAAAIVETVATADRLGLAMQLHEQGHLAEAEALYAAVLAAEPGNFDALHHLGVIRLQQGRAEEALARISAALDLRPDSAEAHSNLGLVFQGLGRSAEALACYDQALALWPDYAAAHNHRGMALHSLGRTAEALESYEQALRLQPDHAKAANNLGMALQSLDRQEEALACFERALAREPDFPEALQSRGLCLLHFGREEEAVRSFDRAVELRPADPNLLVNRGSALHALHRRDAASESYERALALQPDHPEALLADGMMRLSRGDFAMGWERFEARWRSTIFATPQAPLEGPSWRGEEPVAGRKILLDAEQGLGDTLQFVRYVPLVARRGARVVLRVPPCLAPLVADLEGVERVVGGDEPQPDFDLHCPLLSLPLAFGTTLESIPAEVPYLRAPAGRTERWRRRLGEPAGPRIGLVWTGNPSHRDDRNRSVALERLLPLASLPGLELWSLQKEVRDSDRAALAASAIRPLGEELEDFADTAAVMSLLDLVISVDTAAAHLAGALARPVWILLPFSPEWRWMLEREDSPWYPTARLFRQTRPGAWDDLVLRIAGALRERWDLGS